MQDNEGTSELTEGDCDHENETHVYKVHDFIKRLVFECLDTDFDDFSRRNYRNNFKRNLISVTNYIVLKHDILFILVIQCSIIEYPCKNSDNFTFTTKTNFLFSS